ncbi:MAG: hypothetical protein AUI14_06480 [Actinobacteria bacterium 13_2_20CM_2_71_6]|nr:MAG: hypothetical protein AUI14_06480 [Actinobacteria bacterium 13_2_20CM_2_71_6]
MRRPPRSPSESVLGAGLTRAVLSIGTVIAVLALGAGVLAHRSGVPAQTMVFLILGLAQLGVALAVRAPRRPGAGNRWLGLAVLASAALLLGAVLLVPLRQLLGTAALTPPQLLAALAVAALPGAGLAILRRAHRIGPSDPVPPPVPRRTVELEEVGRR